jgi:hypothetical protein
MRYWQILEFIAARSGKHAADLANRRTSARRQLDLARKKESAAARHYQDELRRSALAAEKAKAALRASSQTSPSG